MNCRVTCPIKINNHFSYMAIFSLMANYSGLHVAKHYLFQQTGRPGTPQALVILAAGRSLDDVISPSMELRASGVDVYTVGVGGVYSKLQLHAMASYPHSEHIFRAAYPQLTFIAQNVVTKIVKGED